LGAEKADYSDEMQSPRFGLTAFSVQDSRRQTALGLSHLGPERPPHLDQLRTALATFCDTRAQDATKTLCPRHFVATGGVQIENII
jgi:hypothetical protein